MGVLAQGRVFNGRPACKSTKRASPGLPRSRRPTRSIRRNSTRASVPSCRGIGDPNGQHRCYGGVVRPVPGGQPRQEDGSAVAHQFSRLLSRLRDPAGYRLGDAPFYTRAITPSVRSPGDPPLALRGCRCRVLRGPTSVDRSELLPARVRAGAASGSHRLGLALSRHLSPAGERSARRRSLGISRRLAHRERPRRLTHASGSGTQRDSGHGSPRDPASAPGPARILVDYGRDRNRDPSAHSAVRCAPTSRGSRMVYRPSGGQRGRFPYRDGGCAMAPRGRSNWRSRSRDRVQLAPHTPLHLSWALQLADRLVSRASSAPPNSASTASPRTWPVRSSCW